MAIKQEVYEQKNQALERLRKLERNRKGKKKMKRSERLVVLEELFKSAKEKGEYGGKGPFELPESHKAFMPVTKGGSNCGNCKWVNADSHECMNDYYIKWNGGSGKLPDAPLDEMCSDWWQPK